MELMASNDCPSCSWVVQWVKGSPSTNKKTSSGSCHSRFCNLLLGHYQVRLCSCWVGSRWAGLKTNGDSAQLPVPATLSITPQHMGADNGCTLKAGHAKVCICRSKPQHMGRTLKHSRAGEFNPQDATHRDNSSPSNCLLLHHGWDGKR